MGLEASTLGYIALAASAAGTGAQAINANQQAARQRQIADDQIRTQQVKQHEADSILNANTDAIGRSNGQAERQASLDGFLSQLRANAAAQGGTAAVPGAADPRAQREAAAAKSAIQGYGTDRADILSRIMGPTLQRVNEQNMTNRAASDVTGVNREAQAASWINQLRTAQNVTNPWVQAGGDVLKGAGSAMAANVGNAGQPQLDPINVTAQRASYVPPALRPWGGT